MSQTRKIKRRIWENKHLELEHKTIMPKTRDTEISVFPVSGVNVLCPRQARGADPIGMMANIIDFWRRHELL